MFDPLTNRLRDLICTQVPEGTSVLDVGCGTGHQLSRLAPKINAGFGVDLSDRMIAFANNQKKKKRIDHLSFDLASAVDLSRFRDNEFDLATMTLVLHEMETDLRIPALKEMVRVSKRQIIADYAVSPSLFGSASMHLIEMTVGICHYHLFRSYQGDGGAAGLFRKIDQKSFPVKRMGKAI